MLAMTGEAASASDQHGTTALKFLEHARAIATGEAEGEAFTWFLAAEYQWEMEAACTWLVESPASRLAAEEQEILRRFLGRMPEVRQAIEAGRKLAAHHAGRALAAEGADWLELVALPVWNDFSVRTAVLLSQLGEPARNDGNYGIKGIAADGASGARQGGTVPHARHSQPGSLQ